MTDRELLLHIHGMVRCQFTLERSEIALARQLLEEHFRDSPTPERLSLEARVKSLERIITSKGYQINEELEKLA